MIESIIIYIQFKANKEKDQDISKYQKRHEDDESNIQKLNDGRENNLKELSNLKESNKCLRKQLDNKSNLRFNDISKYDLEHAEIIGRGGFAIVKKLLIQNIMHLKFFLLIHLMNQVHVLKDSEVCFQNMNY